MPQLEYALNHDPHVCGDSGLQLRLPPDKVPANQYNQLTNALSLVEGELTQRSGTGLIIDLSGSVLAPVHSIFRLNQAMPSVITSYVVGVGQDLWVSAAPNPSTGMAFSQIADSSYSGNRLSLVSFRYDDDTAAWLIIGDSAGMMKFRPGTTSTNGYYSNLGIPAPTTAATASAGGVGVLDSTGGTGYDWLYTWLNRVTNSEGNPSPINFTGGSTAVKRPTSNTNPDTGFGGSGFTNPANAYDGVAGTYANGDSATATEARQSCRWDTWAASGGTPNNLAFQVDAQVIVTGTSGTVFVAFYYSTDGGTTWKTLFTASASAARKTYIAPIPAGINFNQLAVRATVFASGQTGDPSGSGRDRSNDVARRIRARGADFTDISDLLDGGGGNRTVELRVYDINTAIVYIGSAANPLNLVNRSANVCVTAPTATQDPFSQITHIRLYRRGGSLPDTWRQVGEYPISSLAAGVCGVGFLTINDNIADSGLGAIIALDNDMPVNSVSQQNVPLPYIWGPFDERVLGCGDPNRPESVYFSKRGNADQWSAANFVIVSNPGEPIINGCVYNTRTFAFSNERMFELVPNLIGGVTFTPYPTPCSRGLVAPHALCVGPAVYFVAKDGIYGTTGGEQVSLTIDSIQPLFPTYDSPGQAVSGYDAVDMTVSDALALEYHNGELWFTYQGANDGNMHQLVYDLERKRWRAEVADSLIYTCYSERGPVQPLFPLTGGGPPPGKLPEQWSGVQMILGTVDGQVLSTLNTTGDTDAHVVGKPIPVTIVTAYHDQGQPLNLKEYGNVTFDMDIPSGQTVNIDVLANGGSTVLASATLKGAGARQRYAIDIDDVLAYNIAFKVTWGTNPAAAPMTYPPILYQYDILWRREPVSVTHWETRETSHGLLGWQHIRDMYVTLRSSVDVVLTVTIDNDASRTFTYTIPSTGGVRTKVYIPMKAAKGKLFHYQFDAVPNPSDIAPSTFQLYEPDIEVRIASWLGDGYQLLKPFGEETITLADYRLPMNT